MANEAAILQQLKMTIEPDSIDGSSLYSLEWRDPATGKIRAYSWVGKTVADGAEMTTRINFAMHKLAEWVLRDEEEG